VCLGRAGGFAPGRKVLTIVHSMVAGGSHIDHADVLRSGATGVVLGHRVMAPSTLGTFLRAFSFGHVRQLDAVIAETIRRAWAAGRGPGSSRLVIDIDSTICEVHGKQKQGAAYGYTRVLGYHPLLATRADTGEILHARMRKGSSNTARGAGHFVADLIARVRAAGATGGIVVRVDSGFWSNKTIATLGRLGVRFTMTVRSNSAINAAIAGIADDAWVDFDYTDAGYAQVGECPYNGLRLIVRRTRLADADQASLFPAWRHHAFLTDLAATAVDADRFHRHHAVVELAIRDLKENSGLHHIPSGNFAANSAWLACAVIAHNLIRWTAAIGGLNPDPDSDYTVGRTHRVRHTTMPARLVNRSGTLTLRAPTQWPWATVFGRRLQPRRADPGGRRSRGRPKGRWGGRAGRRGRRPWPTVRARRAW